jgi:predicted nuclease of restriction endonuclease-like (RecB) superfamily
VLSINENLSRNDLRSRIRNKEYKRLSNRTIEKLVNNEKVEVIDFVKDPIILNKKHDYSKLSEYGLKEIIMNDLDNFLNELGNGFCYIGNEYKIKIGNTYNYIDILLFNVVFNCYVVVELKVNKLTKQDIGQIMIYKNYIDDNIKNKNQTKTIGLIVCKENNKYLIKYSSDSRIQVITYEIV